MTSSASRRLLADDIVKAGDIMSISQQPFGATADGTPIEIYTLSQPGGLHARIMAYGSTLVSLHTPDRQGMWGDVVLGFDTCEPYVAGHPFFGVLVGRYGNRIAGGRFRLNGVEYILERNDGPNHLHGGSHGFDKVVWQAEAGEDSGAPVLWLSYLSRDG